MENHISNHAELFMLLGMISIIGLYAGGIARKIKLPSLIGYMLLGVIIGPSFVSYCGLGETFSLWTFSHDSLSSLAFIGDIALGFVAFSIGSELNMSSLKRQGIGIVSIIFAESLGAFFLVLGLLYWLTSDLPMSLIFASMAPASAPAGTVAIIQEFKAKGSLTQALYAVVGFDDGLAILIFGFSFALAKSLLVQEMNPTLEVSMWSELIHPLKEIGLSFLVGAVVGVFYSWIVSRAKTSRDIQILTIGAILFSTGISVHWHLSLILTNMVVGFVLINTRREELSHKVNEQAQTVMPIFFIFFFCMAGAHLDLEALPKLGVIGVAYIIARIVGLMGGARLGAKFGSVEDKIKNYVGFGILSQAGVAIGLSLIVKAEFEKLGSPHAAEIGSVVITTITASSIFFGIIGPILAKYALEKAGEIEVHKKE